jgi:hypothetical protein
VNLSQLNSATRRLKGQGVAEVRNTGDDYDDMIEDYLDWLESHNMFLHKTREEEKAQIISDLENGYLHSSEIEYAMGEGKEDNIAKLKQNYKDAIYWSKHERSPQKREAARLVAEKIKRHLQKQYQHSMSEATPMAGQTGEITDMQPGKSVTVSAPSGQQGINTMTQIDLTKNPAALSKNDKGELVLKLTPNAGGTPSPTTQQPPQKGTAVKFEALDSILRIAGLK